MEFLFYIFWAEDKIIVPKTYYIFYIKTDKSFRRMK